MNEYFYDRVRLAVFGGKMGEGQRDGLRRILAYRDEKWPKMPDEELAYLLATVVHETAFKVAPVTELGGEKYLRAKPYWPWIGRGLVQITWEKNYAKFGIKDAQKALDWPVALDVAFRGMVLGMFTGKKLSDYIGPGKCDYVAARRIINGTDRAKLIAGYARAFKDALAQARKGPNK